MNKPDSFFSWVTGGLAQDGFIHWAVKNIDTLTVCMLFGLSASVFSAIKENAALRQFMLGIISTFVLIGSIIWVADDYGIKKIWWPLISIAIGLSSLLIIGAYMRFAKTTADQLPDKAAGALVDRVTNAINPSSGDKR